MSQHPNTVSPTTPKTEAWVIIMVLAFVPVLGAMFLPEPTRIPLLAIGGLTFVAGFVLMIRHSTSGSDALRQARRSDGD